MAITAEQTQLYQIGQEGSYGDGSSAGKTMQSISWGPTDKANNTVYGAQGRRASQGAAVEKQWLALAISQNVALYTECLYLYEAAWGTVSATTPGGGTNSRLRVYSPALTGLITPKSLIMQWGDSNNVNQSKGIVLDSISKKWARDGVSMSATGFGITKTTGATFTSSPTVMANQPILGAHINYYMDSTGAGLGTTQLLKTVLNAQFDQKNLRSPFFDSDRAHPSVGDTTDGALATELKLSCVENATTRSLIQYGVTQFLRIETVGPVIESALTYFEKWDLALQLKGDVPFGADGDIWKRDLTFEIVEDATWGHYMQVANQTAEASL